MPTRSRYWSNTKFAEWIRGVAKPRAETSEGWRDWNRQARAAHPVRYWIAEEALDWIQDVVNWPRDCIYNIKYYINNRWVTRTHALTAHPRDIRPGTWCDVGYRFLPCLFNELVDFVEVELAWFHVAWDSEARRKFQSPWWATGWWRWRTWRCAEAGIDNLHWQMGLKRDYLDADNPDRDLPSPQADAAREIYELYRWWTEVRPARLDPHDATGWTAYCERRRQAEPDDWVFGADRENTGPMLDQMQSMEEAYEAEDEAMMIRLIKIRRALWT